MGEVGKPNPVKDKQFTSVVAERRKLTEGDDLIFGDRPLAFLKPSKQIIIDGVEVPPFVIGLDIVDLFIR